MLYKFSPFDVIFKKVYTRQENSGRASRSTRYRSLETLRWLPTVLPKTTLHILRGMRMKFSSNIRDIILKILQQ